MRRSRRDEETKQAAIRAAEAKVEELYRAANAAAGRAASDVVDV